MYTKQEPDGFRWQRGQKRFLLCLLHFYLFVVTREGVGSVSSTGFIQALFFFYVNVHLNNRPCSKTLTREWIYLSLHFPKQQWLTLHRQRCKVGPKCKNKITRIMMRAGSTVSWQLKPYRSSTCIHKEDKDEGKNLRGSAAAVLNDDISSKHWRARWSEHDLNPALE